MVGGPLEERPCADGANHLTPGDPAQHAAKKGDRNTLIVQPLQPLLHPVAALPHTAQGRHHGQHDDR